MRTTPPFVKSHIVPSKDREQMYNGAVTMNQLNQALETYFGFNTFRPLQQEIIQDLLDRKDVFALMPTGGGKSLCYQLPSVLLPGITIVISPLISLMKDQVDALKQNGITSAFLNSSQTTAEQQEIINACLRNEIRLLYIAPERLVQESFLQLLKKVHINFFAIDEAHCISQWGHDFRPEYRQLRVLRTMFPEIAVIALTATATTRVKNDIISQLSLHPKNLYQASFNRPNLMYVIYPKKDALRSIVSYIEKHPHESGIIYCQSRSKVERLTMKLQAMGIKVLAYHAGLPDDIRRTNQESFIKENTDIIVATIAFGMGIDKPNVRFVIHYDLPKSLEHYYQETGRAGRGGLPSDCLFFFSVGDKFFYDRFISSMTSTNEQQISKKHIQKVIDYAQSTTCRRVQLLGYFGETYAETNCAACDNCLSPRETFDGTDVSRKILSCVYRVHERFGVMHIVHILLGSQAEKIMANNHHLLSTYNIITDYSAQDLKQFLYELIQIGYLQQTDDQYGILSLTKKSIPVLKGKETVNLTKPQEKTETLRAQTQDSALDTALFEQLRKLRKTLADAKKVPPYVIFADRSLKEMATYFPQTSGQFVKIYGVGNQKLENYGEIFMQKITQYRTQK